MVPVRCIVLVATALLTLNGASWGQANIFVSNAPGFVGSDLNTGCSKTLPKLTLASAIAGRAICGSAPWVIRMRAGSNFPEGPLALPSQTKLAYWDPANTHLQVTIAVGNPVISISTATGGGASLTATTGLDGTGGAAGTTNIVVDATGPGETGIGIGSTGTFTNACSIANVNVKHRATGISLSCGGGVLSPAITSCVFDTPAPGTSPPGSLTTPGSEHLLMQFTATGTINPSIAGVSFLVAPGAYLERAVFGHTGSGGVMSPSLSACTIAGSGSFPVRGIYFVTPGTAPATVSPSVSNCALTDVGEIGIFVEGGMTGSPTITGVSVIGTGLTLGPLSGPSQWRGNGIAIHSTDGGSLTPTILGTTVDSTNLHSLGLYTDAFNGTAVSIRGSVSGCTFIKGGFVSAGGSGVRLATNQVMLANTEITTAFDSNKIRQNGGDGVSIFTGGYGDEINFSTVGSVFTNNVIDHNGESAVDLFAAVMSAIAPKFIYNTMAYNVGVGWREGPLMQASLDFTPFVYNSIIRFNTNGSTNGPDVSPPAAGGAQIFWSNFAFGAGNNNNDHLTVTLNFANPDTGDFHLAMATPPDFQIIDFATTTPPAAPTLDFDGEGRVFNFLPNSFPDADRGADERHP
ncbi:MAG TPA: hypothetical protein VFI25_19905 [Planctomycetota bacterium]|jgi:hypothetical protein|nr:hypothetical protein [Planctomycetota bacterium]